jgi:hypothetical protein
MPNDVNLISGAIKRSKTRVKVRWSKDGVRVKATSSQPIAVVMVRTVTHASHNARDFLGDGLGCDNTP